MLKCQKALFDLPEQVAYLNTAYMSPLPKPVAAAGVEGIKKKMRPYEMQVNDFFEPAEQVRSLFAKLINVQEPKRIALIPAVSYGMAIVAQNLLLSKGDNIIVVDEQFPSNFYPWQRVAKEKGAEIKSVAPPEKVAQRGAKWNELLLESIDKRTKLVAVSHVHWSDGTVFQLKELRKRSQEVGAWLVIDGTQSVGALPLDVQEIQPDVLICAGYKWLMGPYSSGYAYFNESFDDGKPLEENWISRYKSEDFANLVNYQDAYQPFAMRYDVGERSNFISLPMMREALELLNAWQPKNIQAYCKEMVADELETLALKGFKIEESQYRAAHLFGIRPPEGLDMQLMKNALEANHIMVSYRGSAMRVSPFIFNDKPELDKFSSVLEGLV